MFLFNIHEFLKLYYPNMIFLEKRLKKWKRIIKIFKKLHINPTLEFIWTVISDINFNKICAIPTFVLLLCNGYCYCTFIFNIKL